MPRPVSSKPAGKLVPVYPAGREREKKKCLQGSPKLPLAKEGQCAHLQWAQWWKRAKGEVP